MNPSVRFALVACLAMVGLGLVAAPAAAIEEPANGQFIVELDTDGDADTVFTDEFDLTDPEQRAIFEDARDDPELRAAASQQLREEMQFVSDVASEDLDREIRVGEVAVETVVDGDTGIVAYQFRWENLARLDGDRIVLSEPFSTYDSLDRELVVLAPEGHELTSVSPTPQRQGDDVATWPGLTQFGDGFEVVSTGAESQESHLELEPPSPDEPPTDPADTHGSGPIAFVISALLFGVLFVGRQR